VEDSELKVVFVSRAFERQTGYSKGRGYGTAAALSTTPIPSALKWSRIYVAVETKSTCTGRLKQQTRRLAG
jgi:hypothetical protein